MLYLGYGSGGTQRHESAADFLKWFNATGQYWLQPGQGIRLVIGYGDHSLACLLGALGSPLASRVFELNWGHSDYSDNGVVDVSFVVPLIVRGFPNLRSLGLAFERAHLAFDIAAMMLESTGTQLYHLTIPNTAQGDFRRMFDALEKSGVRSLAVSHDDEIAGYDQRLSEYIALGALEKLEMSVGGLTLRTELSVALSRCTSLVQLNLQSYRITDATSLARLPKSIVKMEIMFGRVDGPFDWSFLDGSSVRDLKLHSINCVDACGNFEDVSLVRNGDALKRHLHERGMDHFHIRCCSFTEAALIAAGDALKRVKKLSTDCHCDDQRLYYVTQALRAPGCEIQVLRLYTRLCSTTQLDNSLWPALRDVNCTLKSIGMERFDEVCKVEVAVFHNRVRLFVLLSAQRLRRTNHVLRKLPVEMFRVLGTFLQ